MAMSSRISPRRRCFPGISLQPSITPNAPRPAQPTGGDPLRTASLDGSSPRAVGSRRPHPSAPTTPVPRRPRGTSQEPTTDATGLRPTHFPSRGHVRPGLVRTRHSPYGGASSGCTPLPPDGLPLSVASPTARSPVHAPRASRTVTCTGHRSHSGKTPRECWCTHGGAGPARRARRARRRLGRGPTGACRRRHTPLGRDPFRGARHTGSPPDAWGTGG